MSQLERKEKILQLLTVQRKLSIPDLSQNLGVSANTIRLDVNALALEGLVLKQHGFVFLPKDKLWDYSAGLSSKHQKNIKGKQIIGALVLEQLDKNKDLSLFFDSSTSCLEVARLLKSHPKRLTVITHFLTLGQMLSSAPNISVFLCGGNLWPPENCTLGPNVSHDLKKYHADIAIVGCTGLDMAIGVSNGNIETVEIKQIMSNNANETWLLCDHTKFGVLDLLQAFSFKSISRIFTDLPPNDEWLNFFSEKNICIHYRS